MKDVKAKELPGLVAKAEQTGATLSAIRESMREELTPDQDEALAHAIRLCEASAGFMRSDFVKRVVKR